MKRNEKPELSTMEEKGIKKGLRRILQN